MSYFGQQPKQQMCVNFKKGCCNNPICKFVHNYRYCFKYQNTKCTIAKCRYLHVTSVAQAHYETTGVVTDQLRYEIGVLYKIRTFVETIRMVNVRVKIVSAGISGTKTC
ncbi:hypothetical protein PUN28_020535 [Cardiocondyla obscurior]|uniref:C3H1-type domain-containing protein n=1 Tax=Cardiocondyla obscurior TaxID=286306 RepID=A0AAW2E8I1_9HYME